MLRKLKNLAFSRVFLIGLLIAAQLVLILLSAVQFTRYYVFYSAAAFALALAFVLRICNTGQSMAYKLAWTVVIFVFPAFGVAIYVMLGGNRLSPRTKKKMRFMNDMTSEALRDSGIPSEGLSDLDPHLKRQTEYIRNAAFCPPYRNCETTYYSTGEEAFPELCKALEAAERYIFLEYFIIGKGKMWDRIHEILLRKAREGVEVRVIYDDIGCIMTLDRAFADRLEEEGIRCRVFHKFIPVLSSRQNNRDHRKIAVIDGITAFTGGFNLADEYINEEKRFGYWKDNAVRISGEAAWSFAVLFLSMWDYLDDGERKTNLDEFKPSPDRTEAFRGRGIVQPYADSPLDDEPVGENVYLSLLAEAQEYVWITTPYLVLDEQLERALCRAARSGVDVRILTPGIPDKRIVNQTAKSYYPNLLAGGVKILEYEPGFLHSKTFLCDGKYATVGSVNLDYRSLYLHFECGVWMADTDCIPKIRADLENTMAHCRPAELPSGRMSLIAQFLRGLLELISPLL